MKKLSIAAAALAAATFVPAGAFAMTGPAHPAAQASSSVVKAADVYRPARPYRRYGGCCATPVYVYGCGCGGCGCGSGWGSGWGWGSGLGWGAGWGGGCGCGSGWGGGGFWPFW